MCKIGKFMAYCKEIGRQKLRFFLSFVITFGLQPQKLARNTQETWSDNEALLLRLYIRWMLHVKILRLHLNICQPTAQKKNLKWDTFTGKIRRFTILFFLSTSFNLHFEKFNMATHEKKNIMWWAQCSSSICLIYSLIYRDTTKHSKKKKIKNE